MGPPAAWSNLIQFAQLLNENELFHSISLVVEARLFASIRSVRLSHPGSTPFARRLSKTLQLWQLASSRPMGLPAAEVQTLLNEIQPASCRNRFLLACRLKQAPRPLGLLASLKHWGDIIKISNSNIDKYHKNIKNHLKSDVFHCFLWFIALNVIRFHTFQ